MRARNDSPLPGGRWKRLGAKYYRAIVAPLDLRTLSSSAESSVGLEKRRVLAPVEEKGICFLIDFASQNGSDRDHVVTALELRIESASDPSEGAADNGNVVLEAICHLCELLLLRLFRGKKTRDVLLFDCEDVIPKRSDSLTAWRVRELVSKQTRRHGGVSESEVRAFAVAPAGPFAAFAVTTLTPVAQWPIRRRNSDLSINSTRSPNRR